MRATFRPLDVPLTAPFRIATGEVRVAKGATVEVGQDGIVGIGESTPFEVITGGTQELVLASLAALKPEFQPGADVASTLDAVGAGRLPPDARHAVDVAIHDWWARRRGVPLATMLGRAPRPLRTSVTIPIVPLADVSGLVHRALQDGFTILKVKSKAGVEEETKRIRLVRDLAGPGVEIRVDANAGWSRQEATRMVSVLQRCDVEFLEQPLDRGDLEGLASLVAAGSVPIMVDESVFTLADAERVLEAKAADMINVKLAKSGGVLEAARILRLAEAAGVPCMVGCMIQTRIATSVDAHVAAAFPSVRYVDLDGHTFLAEDPVEGGVEIHQGRLVFPDAPGHGARLSATATVTAGRT